MARCRPCSYANTCKNPGTEPLHRGKAYQGDEVSIAMQKLVWIIYLPFSQERLAPVSRANGGGTGGICFKRRTIAPSRPSGSGMALTAALRSSELGRLV